MSDSDNSKDRSDNERYVLPFLQLPTELRLEIYSAFHHGEFISMSHNGESDEVDKYSFAFILKYAHVNRQVHAEIFDYVSRCKYLCLKMAYVQDAYEILPSELRESITDVCLTSAGMWINEFCMEIGPRLVPRKETYNWQYPGWEKVPLKHAFPSMKRLVVQPCSSFSHNYCRWIDERDYGIECYVADLLDQSWTIEWLCANRDLEDFTVICPPPCDCRSWPCTIEDPPETCELLSKVVKEELVRRKLKDARQAAAASMDSTVTTHAIVEDTHQTKLKVIVLYDGVFSGEMAD